MRTEAERVTVRHPVASTSLSMYPPQVPVISPTMFGSLPNIEGELNTKGLEDSGIFTGVFKSSTKGAFSYTSHAAGGSGLKTVFQASDGNNIYNGSVVQTSALQALVCIKF